MNTLLEHFAARLAFSIVGALLFISPFVTFFLAVGSPAWIAVILAGALILFAVSHCWAPAVSEIEPDQSLETDRKISLPVSPASGLSLQ